MTTAPSAPSTSAEPKTLYCSFCGKSQHELEKLISGPGVFICNECVGLCDQILAGQPIVPSLPSWDEMTDEDLLRRMVSIAASRDQVEQVLTEAVRRLRARSVTWARIGETLGMTRQSAWERFSGEE